MNFFITMIFFIGFGEVRLGVGILLSYINEEVCVMLFVSSTYKIKMVIGAVEKVFQTDASPIFSLDADVTALEWSTLFVDPPSFNKDKQILYTNNQEKVLFTISRVSSNEFEFLISMVNITKCSKIQLQQSVSADGVNLDGMVVVSERMKRIMEIVEKISRVNSTVLLLGESGVGKSFLARKIHALSERASQPFVSLNCASLPQHLIESELFGYEPGAFTGGKKGGKIGLFEAADKGTIFLDEIAELPFDMQSKLLDVLQENTIRRIGSVESKQIDVRVIAATNKDLATLVKNKKFREDLYYRLNVVPLEIPPLRERKKDLPALIDHFLRKFNKKYNQAKIISPHIIQKFMLYDWPGNIRELENIIERMVVTNSENVFEFLMKDESFHVFEENTVQVKGLVPLKKAKKMIEKELIIKAYEMYGSTYKAAKVLQVDQSTVVKKLKEFQYEQM